MLIIGILILIYIPICLVFIKKDFDETVLFLLFISFCLIGTTLFGISMSIIGERCSFKIDKQQEIYLLNDNIGTSGNFTLGSGYIKSEMYYFYYIETDFGYKIEKLISTNVYIKENEELENNAIIKTYCTVLENPDYVLGFGYVCPHKETIVIEVPKGTIVKNMCWI